MLLAGLALYAGLTLSGLVEIGWSVPKLTGFNVSGAIELASTPALTVPESALVFDDGMSYVFTTGADSRAMRTKVAVGRRAEGRVEILSGLEPDAKVVASGGAFLSNGATVAIVTSKEASN